MRAVRVRRAAPARRFCAANSQRSGEFSRGGSTPPRVFSQGSPPWNSMAGWTALPRPSRRPLRKPRPWRKNKSSQAPVPRRERVPFAGSSPVRPHTARPARWSLDHRAGAVLCSVADGHGSTTLRPPREAGEVSLSRPARCREPVSSCPHHTPPQSIFQIDLSYKIIDFIYISARWTRSSISWYPGVSRRKADSGSRSSSSSRYWT